MKRKRLLAIVMVLAFMTTFMVSTTTAAPAEESLACLDDHDGEHEVIVHYDDEVLSSGDIDLSWDTNEDEIIEPESMWVTGEYNFWTGWSAPDNPNPAIYQLSGQTRWRGFIIQYKQYEFVLITPNPDHMAWFTVDVDETAAASGYRVKNYTVTEDMSGSTWTEASVPFDITSPCYASPGEITWDVTVNLEVEATFVSDDGTSTAWVDQGSTPTAPSVSGPYFTGWDPELGPIDEPTTFTAQYREPEIGLGLTKVADVDSGLVAGDTVTYTFTVTNTGEETVTGINLSDPGVSFAAGVTAIGDLASGQSASVTGTYTVTEGDMFAGSYVNNASVTGYFGNDEVSAQATETVETDEPAPGISITKQSETSEPGPGDTIDYVLMIENTGNVTLYNVIVTDDNAVIPDGSIGTMEPGTVMTMGAMHVVTEDDLWANGGVYDNEATVTGYDAEENEVSDSDDESVDLEDPDPSIQITKSVDTGDGVDLGDTVTYTLTVTNDGNVTLYSVEVEDALVAGLTDDGVIGTMEPGAVKVLTGTYTITEDDIWMGIVENTATVTGLTAVQGEVSDTASQEFNTADMNLDAEITKEADVEPTDVLLIGETVVYTFTVTNTGNVSIEKLDVTDAAIGYSETFDVDLAPGDSITLSVAGSYTIQESDSFVGSFTNVANVVATTGLGDFYTEPIDSNEVTVLVEAAMPMISLTKVALVEEGVVPSAGDMLSYEITVTNNGNVTLYSVYVTDDMIGLDEGPLTLEPGESQTFTQTDAYEVTEGDMFNGEVENRAYAIGLTEEQLELEAFASATVDVEDADPSIDIVKTSDQSNYFVGDTIEYTLTVTNDGNVTLYDGEIIDTFLGGLMGTFNILAPGESVVVGGNHLAISSDTPGITNLAETHAYTYGGDDGYGEYQIIVIGEPISGFDGQIGPTDGFLFDSEPQMVSDEDELFVSVSRRPVPKIPGISISIIPDSYVVDAGTEVVFTVTVTNIGNTVLNNVTVVDEDLGLNETIANMFVGSSEQFSVPMTMTVAGDFDTTASAAGTAVGAGAVNDTDSTTVEVLEEEDTPEDTPEEPDEPVVPPEEPVPGDTTENPETGAIPFGMLSTAGFLAMGAGVLGLFFRKKEDEDEE